MITNLELPKDDDFSDLPAVAEHEYRPSDETVSRRKDRRCSAEMKLLNLAIRHRDIVQELKGKVKPDDFIPVHQPLLAACYAQDGRSNGKRLLTRENYQRMLIDQGDKKNLVPRMSVYDRCDIKMYADKDSFDAIFSEWESIILGDRLRSIFGKGVPLVGSGSTAEIKRAISYFADAFGKETNNNLGEERFMLSEPESLKELIESIGEEESSFIFDGIIKRGSNTMLVAPWKAGKSTWLGGLLVAIAEGADFGLSTNRVKVLWLSEECKSNWNDKPIKLSENVVILTRDKIRVPTNDDEWSRFISEIAAWCVRHEIGLVVFDTVSSLCGIENENDNALVTKRLRELNKINVSGTATILVHHSSKAALNGEGTVIHSRGAGAFSAFTDCNVRLKSDKKSNSATIDWDGRYGTGEQHYRFDEDEGYSASTIEPEGSNARQSEYMRLLNGRCLTAVQIESEEWNICKPSLKTIRRDLKKLVGSGVFHEEDGAGAKVYTLIDMKSILTPPCTPPSC